MTIQFLDDEPISQPQATPQVTNIPQPVVSVPLQIQPVERSWFSRRSFLLGFVCAAGLLLAYLAWNRGGIIDDGDDKVVTDRGFRAMIVYDATKVGSLTEGQQAVLTSVPVRQWLDANTVKDDGNNGYWIGDVDTQLDKLSPALQAMKREAKPPYPCVIISNPPKRLLVEELRRDIGPQRFIQLLEGQK